MVRVFVALTCIATLTACTTSVGLKYSPSPATVKLEASTSPVVIGSFVDQRGEPSNWLGAIRGGFGNPLKNLESDQPVSTLVQAAFSDGLRARGVVIDSTSAPVQISGVIHQLDCNQMVRREANVEIEVSVTEISSGHQRFSRTYTATNVDGSLLSLSTGIFASVDELRAVTEKTLREVVDKALNDTSLRASLRL